MSDNPAERAPVELPSNFDDIAQMPAAKTDHGNFHVTRDAARLVRRLVENGTDEDLERAVPILNAVLSCQERDSSNPHFGNFYWMAEDSEVVDLNAVSFTLAEIIPLLLDSRERLSRAAVLSGEGTALIRRVEDSVRIALDAVVRLDVLVGYTNIAMFDIANCMLGGELLQDRALSTRATAKLEEWISHTNRAGHPLEFNSPTYTPIALRTLDGIAQRYADSSIGVLAKVMSTRIALSVALHLHRETGRWAGPHGRSYYNAVTSGTTQRESELFEEFTTGRYRALNGLIDGRRSGSFVLERTTYAETIDLWSYFSRNFCLGTTSRPLHVQSNVVIAYYGVSEAEHADVFYTRYLTDDKWYGAFYHPTDRSNSRNLLDEGDFLGVQDRNVLIGAYSPKSLQQTTGAKSALVWSNIDHIDEVLVDGVRVRDFPLSIRQDSTIGVAAGSTFFAIRPITLTSLGSGSGGELVEREGQLVLELVQYRGQQKDFWELRNPGPFYQGRPVNAFYMELAERENEHSLEAFARRVSAGTLDAAIDPPRTFSGKERRAWKGTYRRDDFTISLGIDLYRWEVNTTEKVDDVNDNLMLDSPNARQVRSGPIELDGARLESSIGPLWLCGDRENDTWIAGVCGAPQESGSVSLRVPSGTVNLHDVRACLIEWERGEVSVCSMSANSIVGSGPGSSAGSRPEVSGGVLRSWRCGT